MFEPGDGAEGSGEEERFRQLLDDLGVLRLGAMASPDRAKALTVFAQRDDAALDMNAMKAHASRFFAAKLGLTVEKHYGLHRPDTDIARVVLSAENGVTSGTRLCFARRADEGDHAAAERAERMQNTSGMSLLAQRCKMVWLIVLDSAEDLDRDRDRVALTIAAIFASSLLGPILSPKGDELFGVRTARAKLDAF
jgi:hypothetical protein